MIKGTSKPKSAPKLKWFSRAEWKPVIYSTPSNSHEGSELYNFPHWDWSKPVDELLELAQEVDV